MEREHYLFKIIIIGDSGVGKTALVNRYIKDVVIKRYVKVFCALDGHALKKKIY